MGQARDIGGLLEFIEHGGEPTIYCHHVTYEPDGGNVICRIWQRKHGASHMMHLQAVVIMQADDLAVSARAARQAAADAHNLTAFRREFEGKASN